MSEAPRVFISYRVDDGLAVASALARELERTLSWGSVFLDHRSLEPGEPWPARLRDEVRRADVVLVLIGPRWLTLQGADGVRRLDDPDDWVRLEIEDALTSIRIVIPVLVDGAAPLEKRAFRTIPQIERLADVQAITLSTKQWEATFDALVARLEELGFRRAKTAQARPTEAPTTPFRSTIPARGHAPFVGRKVLLDQLRLSLADGASQAFVVLHGPPGVGKSELAREYGRRQLPQYPGGAFYVSVREVGPPVDLAAFGRTVLALDYPVELTLRDQCLRTLLSMGRAPFLLIYDNAQGPESVEAWLPPAGGGGHVIVTSTWDRWDLRWQRVPVPPMADVEAASLVSAIIGSDPTSQPAKDVIRYAGGLPVQLVPAAQSLRVAIDRHQPVRELADLVKDARASFAVPWSHVSAEGRLLLAAATYFHPDRVSRGILAEAFTQAAHTGGQFDLALDGCLDLSLITGVDPLCMHGLLARYVQEHVDELDAQLLRGVREALQARFVRAAQEVVDHPGKIEAVETLTTFSTDPTRWFGDAQEPGGLDIDAYAVGRALSEIGHFADARPWYERAVAEKEQGGVQGRIDHASLGRNLHQVGFCLSEQGQFAEARRWYERAVAEKEQGDVQGQVDRASLGVSLHQIGVCLSEQGQFAEARPWYERAVAEAEQGDKHGRIDHEALGRSLHQVGFCLSSQGQFAEARPWYERAVAEAEQGDVHGRIDHEALGRSLHQVGFCLSDQGQFAEAQPWYERAVTEAQQGDVQGQVDRASLGRSLHQVGFCLSAQGQFAAARPWYERAVVEIEQGDVHGRINHESLGVSLHQVGLCLSSQGQFAEARPWFERAVAEKEQGDVHGRLDHASLGTSLHEVGSCLSLQGHFAEAREWFDRAVAEKEQGDVHGRIHHASLGTSLHQVGFCLSEQEQFAGARPWYERAVAEAEQGDVHGRIDHEVLGRSLHQVGLCLASQGQFVEAQPWFERAVAKKEQGDLHGRIDHESLALSRAALGFLATQAGGPS